MKALVKVAKGPGNVELRDDWPRPAARPGWVVVEVAGCGICGTDLHIQEDTHKNWPPVILGHEYTGRIVEVGDDVSEWRVGDRVVCEQHHGACLACDVCRRGAIHLCSSKRSPGWGIDGAFAEYVALPAWLLHRVPDGVSFRAAAVTEPTAICITGLDRAQLKPGERVLVVGPGPIGLISALLARAAGASQVVVAGRASSNARLELAASLGLETFLLDTGAELTSGFDVAIETTGAGSAIAFACGATRAMGRLVELGIASESLVDFPLNVAMYRALTVSFSMSSEYSSWDRALALMATGRFDPVPITRAYSLDDWETAFHDVERRVTVKPLISPDVSRLDELR